MLTKTLQLTFADASGKNMSITVAEPKTTLTDAEVKAAMQAILTGNYFQTNGGELKQIVGARITSRDTSDLVVK